MAKRKPAPTDLATGTVWIQAAMVDMFDRQDGTGADWRLVVESVFRAGFEIADAQFAQEAQQSFFAHQRRIVLANRRG